MNIEVLTADLDLTVRNRKGLIVQHWAGPSRSPVRALLEAILSMVIATNVATVDTGGAADNVGPATANLLDSTGAVNDDTQGIVVGTGVTAVDIADSGLATKVAHGTGSGQLSHAAQTMDSQVTTETGSVYFDITRTFTNSSGALIKLFECGIYAHNGLAGGSADTLCLMRDMVTPLYAFNGSTVTVKYRLRITL